MKISVIIPVYNSKNYLRKCLNSLKKQSYQKLEIILVDDGSTDNSLKICKSFKVYHQKNKGTSAARNYGLSKATGNYVTFVDNDDYIKGKNSFLEISKILEKSNPDVLLHSCIYYWENKNKLIYPKKDLDFSSFNNVDFNSSLNYLIKNSLYSYTVWDKVIKLELLRENSISFSEGKRNEDSEFCIKLMKVAKSYDYFNKSFYIYRKGHGYAQTSSLKYFDTKDLKDIIVYYLEDENSELEYYIKNYIAYLYAVYLAQTKFIKSIDIKRDIKEMKNYKYLLKYNLNNNMKFISLVYKIFGFNITRNLLYVFMKLKYSLKGE